MKTKKLFIVCIASLMLMAGCSQTHTEPDNWVADATTHWKLCDDCGKKIKTGKHSLNDVYECTVCNSEVIEYDEAVSVTTYDKHKNPIRTAEYDTKGNLQSETTTDYKYDSNDNLTKATEYIDGRLNSETEYTVNNGESSPSKLIQYNEDNTKFINEYDSYGNVIKLIDYDANGNINMQSVSTYAKDDNGEWYQTDCTETYNDGTKIEAKYNNHGKNTARKVYDSNGNITSNTTWEYTYDGKGNPKTTKEYENGTLVSESIYKTITNEDESETTTYPETIITYNKDGGKTVSVYDQNDNLISETKYDAYNKQVK